MLLVCLECSDALSETEKLKLLNKVNLQLNKVAEKYGNQIRILLTDVVHSP